MFAAWDGGDSGQLQHILSQLSSPEAEMRLQYREFIRRLGEVGKEKGSAELTSIQIIAKFLDPKEDLYKDIEGPLSVLARACVAQGVEAIVESWVSVLENHSSRKRNN